MTNRIFIENCEHFAKAVIFAFENHLITNTTNEDQTEYLFKLANNILAGCPNQIVLNNASRGEK
jgi:hypothetical protein